MHPSSSSVSQGNHALYKLSFFVLALSLYGILGIYGHMHSKGPFTHSVTIKVSNGESLPQISQKLYDMGLIRSKFLFNLYIRCTQKDRSLKKGRYVFEPYASESHVADSIFRGFGMYYRVFLPEGFTTLHMINSIKKYRFFEKDKFTEPKEGELYPDTYKVEGGTSYSSFIRLMKDRMKSAVQKAWSGRKANLYFKTPEEMLIAASLIEKETFLKTERPVIAGVIINRLKKNMRLQIDPSVIYGITKTGLLGRPLTRKDLKKVTPYNTYRKKGLPPTPICNPGEKSLLAAANPAPTDHMYYVATGKGGHHFAEDYNKHLQNVKSFKEVLKKKPVQTYSTG